MKDINIILTAIREVITAHFQECAMDCLYGESRYLVDTDHETIEDLMEEFRDTLMAELLEED